jgi:hypothetical protein
MDYVLRFRIPGEEGALKLHGNMHCGFAVDAGNFNKVTNNENLYFDLQWITSGDQ